MIEIRIIIVSVGGRGNVELGLARKGHKGTFRDVGHVLYLDMHLSDSSESIRKICVLLCKLYLILKSKRKDTQGVYIDPRTFPYIKMQCSYHIQKM